MKVREIMDKLVNCNPEDEVFLYGYDRGANCKVKDVRTVNEDNVPYDRNGWLWDTVEKNGRAVLICDYKW